MEPPLGLPLSVPHAPWLSLPSVGTTPRCVEPPLGLHFQVSNVLWLDRRGTHHLGMHGALPIVAAAQRRLAALSPLALPSPGRKLSPSVAVALSLRPWAPVGSPAAWGVWWRLAHRASRCAAAPRRQHHHRLARCVVGLRHSCSNAYVGRKPLPSVAVALSLRPWAPVETPAAWGVLKHYGPRFSILRRWEKRTPCGESHVGVWHTPSHPVRSENQRRLCGEPHSCCSSRRWWRIQALSPPML